MQYLLTSYALDLCAALVSTYLGFVSLACAARFRTAANSNTLVNGLAKISAAREHDGVSLFAHTPRMGRQVFEDVDGSQHHGGPMNMCVICIMLAELPTLPAIRNKKPPRPCSVTRLKNEILLYRSLHVPPESWDRSADISWHKSYR